ncbi:asparagine synthase (glutamine-hydrolyzing) [Altererythrobacter sp. MF3-039]|uniref:asparagine synthase (glutamine-hydrolyzing) n=1 Tax=Altererythrobacter sp. MF3-039 TaxID=3252901 RepID=UPI00390CA972
MCGICGCIVKGDNLPSERARSATLAMREALGHRGPNGVGLFESGSLYLGHTRLSVIDPEHAAQPMTAADGRLALSYNGEIYNFRELMVAERHQGWDFVTRSDTEVLLASFARQGVDCDANLNGMYAFAAYDGRQDRNLLFLASDPVGIKPLFLFDGPDCVLFASELRAILDAFTCLGIDAVMDSDGVESYLANGYVAPPHTLVRGVRRFGPGERAAVNTATGHINILERRRRPVVEVRQRSEAELVGELRHTLSQAVERQLVADVPLGIFLSGGVDSSLILAAAADHGTLPDCYTIAFKGEGTIERLADESAVAREVAGHFGAPIHEIEFTSFYLADQLEPTLKAMDQPLADPACLPLYALASVAKDGITVAMSGDGGDELFAGYLRHRMALPKNRWHSIPRPIRQAASGMMDRFPESMGGPISDKLRRAKIAFDHLDDPAYVRGPLADGRAVDVANLDVAPDAFSLMNADIDGQLAGQMLMKTDNMTMAHSLECRVPMLDLEMIELASSVPLTEKQNWRKGKLPLRALLSQYLPPAISERPKHGFRVPLTSWFRSDLRDLVENRLDQLDERIEEAYGFGRVRGMMEAHFEGRSDKSNELWALLALQTWVATHLGG